MKTATAKTRLACVDALHRHCRNARAIAALLEWCAEVDAGRVNQEAVGDAAWLLGQELDALRGCVRGLEEVR